MKIKSLIILLFASAILPFTGCISVHHDVPDNTTTTVTKQAVVTPETTTVERTTTY